MIAHSTLASSRSDRRSIVIGHSVRGSPIRATIIGASEAPCRALVIAGQHGDEPGAMEALRSLLVDWLPPTGVSVAFLPCANPDGAAAGRRANAQGIDLNRDHQRLRSPECRAIHAFARSWAPDLVIDAHTFKARRRALTCHGFEWGADVMVEIDNHPRRLLDYPTRWRQWLQPVVETLRRQALRCDRYLLVMPSGRVRTSSADIVDARNGLAARLGTTGVLVEGREASRAYGSADRTRHAVALAVRAVLDRLPFGPGAKTPSNRILHLDAKRVRSELPVTAHVLSKGECQPSAREIPGRPYVDLMPARPIVAPMAYGVPNRARTLTDLLRTHGFVAASAERVQARLRFEDVARISGGRAAKRPGRPLRNPTIDWDRRVIRPDDKVWYFLDQPLGSVLSAFLEPGSRFGLHRYADLGVQVVSGRDYLISRGVGHDTGVSCSA